MTLKDLKTGWRVRTRNGDMYVVLKDCETRNYGHQDVMFINLNTNDFIVGSVFDSNSLVHSDFEYDIMEVYETVVNGLVFDKARLGKLVWERTEEPKDMTLSEIEDALGYPVRIVGDNNGTID